MPTPRDVTAASLLLDALPDLPTASPWLLVGDIPSPLGEALRATGSQVSFWRRAAHHGSAQPTPPPGPFASIAVRLPRARDTLDMMVHLTAARTLADAPIYLFGANDEGIKSSGKRLSPLFDRVQTVDTRRHCRLWTGRRSQAPARGSLEDWRRDHAVELPGGPRSLRSYPGCFAKGRLDAGTALLLEHLPAALQPRPTTVLDLACGVGVIGAAVEQLLPERDDQPLRLDGCDIDAIALHAAAHNARFDRRGLGDGPAALDKPEAGWDLIVSNPPFHRGFDDDLSIAREWIAQLPTLLAPGGRALLVVQRHRPVLNDLRAALPRVDTLADARGYRVYLCHKT